VDERSRAAVEQAERHADGLIDDVDLNLACREASKASDELEKNCVQGAGIDAERLWNAAEMAWSVTAAWQHVCEVPIIARHVGGGLPDVIALLREVVGNPFRFPPVDPAWLNDAVVSLARAAYCERTLPAGTLHADRLAVLSDALEESGCNDQQFLAHLRSGGPHVRGCWALDLVLGKE
jgi:hypothetical protein